MQFMHLTAPVVLPLAVISAVVSWFNVLFSFLTNGYFNEMSEAHNIIRRR